MPKGILLAVLTADILLSSSLTRHPGGLVRGGGLAGCRIKWLFYGFSEQFSSEERLSEGTYCSYQPI